MAVFFVWQIACVAVLTVIAVILCVAGYRAIDRAVKKWWRRQKMYS